MVYTILISIVFIAELIIAITVIQNLIKLDSAILETGKTLTLAKPGIKDISVLVRKISEQFVVFSEDFVDKYKKRQEDIILRHLSKILLAILLVKINSKFINNFRNSSFSKLISKGLSLIENMV